MSPPAMALGNLEQLILPAVSTATKTEGPFYQLPRWLTTLDLIIFTVAGLLMVGGAIRWVWRGPRDPLRTCPARPHGLGEDAVLLAVMAYLLAATAFAGLARIVTDDPEDVLARLVVSSGAQFVGVAVCLVIVAHRFEGGLRRFFFGPKELRGGQRLTLMISVSLVTLATCPLVLEGSVRVIRYFAPGHEFPLHPTITALHEGTPSVGVRVALWLGAGVAAPIAEEVFFRGVLQSWLVKVLRNRWTAIILASVVFALVHYSQPHALPALAVLAMFMGYAYERTGALVSPMVVHAVFNLKTLIWDAYGEFPAAVT